MTVPAMVAVLVAGPPWFATAAATICILCAFLQGPRIGSIVAVAALCMFAILLTGMGFWLPREAATAGSIRVVAVSILLMVPMFFVNAAVLVDTLIDRFRVPYRLLDALMLGGRFAVLMRQDFRLALGLASLRAMGNPFRRAGLRTRTILVVLAASFRHSEQLAIAMDSRGFGMYPNRTVRNSRAIATYDICVLAGVWTASIVLAVILEWA